MCDSTWGFLSPAPLLLSPQPLHPLPFQHLLLQLFHLHATVPPALEWPLQAFVASGVWGLCRGFMDVGGCREIGEAFCFLVYVWVIELWVCVSVV